MTITDEITSLRKQKEAFLKSPPVNLEKIKKMLQVKHQGNLTKVAQNLGLNYNNMSSTLNGRLYLTTAVSAIQQDLNLTDEQVLNLWPLLKTWPRENKRAM